MQCTHRFHKECITNLAAAQKMAVNELRCPTCKTPPCSDEDALSQCMNNPDEPMQAINLEDTQEFSPGDLADTAVDLADTAVDLVGTADPEGADSDTCSHTTDPEGVNSQGSDMAPILEVTAREHKRRLEAGLRTEPIAKKCKAPPPCKADTKTAAPTPPKAKHGNAKLANLSAREISEANFKSRTEARARDRMAKLLGAGPPKIFAVVPKTMPRVPKTMPAVGPTAAAGPKPSPAVPKTMPVVKPKTLPAGPKPSPAVPKTMPVVKPKSQCQSTGEYWTSGLWPETTPGVPKPSKSMHVPSPKPTCSTTPSVAPELLQCDLCGSYVTRDMTRVHSKKAETYKCGKCASAMTKVYRRPGGLPKDKTWAKEKRHEYWQLMHEQHNAESIDEITNRFTQTEYKKDESHYDNSGEFLPLSVWTQRGFNAESIEKNTIDSNIRDDPVLGKIYRVVIQSSGHRGAHGAEEQRQHRLAPAEAATAAPQAAPKAAPTLDALKAEVERVESSQKAEEQQAKLQTRKIKELVAQCLQLTSMCSKNSEMVPNNITVQADRLAQEVEEIKIQAETSDVAKASPYLYICIYIYI